MFDENETKDLLKDIAEAPGKTVNIMKRENLKIDNLEDPMQKLVMTLYSTIAILAARAQFIIEKDRG